MSYNPLLLYCLLQLYVKCWYWWFDGFALHHWGSSCLASLLRQIRKYSMMHAFVSSGNMLQLENGCISSAHVLSLFGFWFSCFWQIKNPLWLQLQRHSKVYDYSSLKICQRSASYEQIFSCTVYLNKQLQTQMNSFASRTTIHHLNISWVWRDSKIISHEIGSI